MSEIKLVRCPKCDKVLPEPPVFTVYQCGGCGAVLQAKKKSSGSGKLGVKGEEGVKNSGESRVVREGDFDMGSKSPMRSTFGDGSEIKSSMEESDLNEFHGGFPKSPMRDRFLNDLSSTPMGSRDVSPSPMMSRDVSPSPMRGRGLGELDFDDVGQSSSKAREVSMSPIRGEQGNRSPMSVRTRNFSMSPRREVGDANNRSPARSTDGKIANSPLRGDDVPGFDEKVENEQEGNLGDCDESEKEDRRDKMTPKTSFNFWLSDESPARESDDNGLGRRRKKWRDVIGDDADKISEGKESVNAYEHGMTSEGSVDDQTQGDARLRGDYIRGYRKAKANVDYQFTGSDDGTGMIHTNSRVALKGKRNSVSTISADEYSSDHLDFCNSYGHPRRSSATSRGHPNVHYMEHVEHIKNHKVAGDYLEEEHLRCRQGYMQHFSPDKTMPRSSYYDHGPGLGHEMEDAYNHFPLYEDPYAQPMGSEHFPKQPQFPRHAMPGYYPRQSWDFDRNSVGSYNNGIHRHYPADGQGFDPPSSFGNRRSSNLFTHQSSSHSLNLQRPGPRTYDPRMAHTSPRERPSHLAPHRARNASQNKRLCLPIAGGSPFLLCHNCSELLKLPGKFMKKQKNEYKLQCGACSSIISFDLQKNSFGVCSSQKKPDTDSAVSGSDEVLSGPKSRPRHHHGSFAATSTTLGSYDFDAGRLSFQSMESTANEPSTGRKMVSNNDGNIQGISPTSRFSKDELVSDSTSARISLHNSSKTSLKVRPPPGSPLREHLDYSGQYHKAEPENARNDYGEEKQELEKDISQDSSVVNTTVASETEVHSYGLSNSLSDSREDEYDDAQPAKSPIWKSPFASKSIPASPGKVEVFVNGQQVPHHVVKKAEKLAGPIESGDYWYDPKAGFWGVMGHPGLGILPPSIPEFSFPMSESCSRGDTAVYVNGRELEKSDLDLLVKRGLPTMRDRRYIIDISGKVLEEQSKDFIVNLGKLAPTIEKVRRGFGMRVPKHLKD